MREEEGKERCVGKNEKIIEGKKGCVRENEEIVQGRRDV